MLDALRYLCIRPKATYASGLKLLEHEALAYESSYEAISYSCMRP